jgi:TatD DNase family protein
VFDEDRAEVITRARLAGVEKIISVSENLADAERNLILSKFHPEILPAAGLYPTYLDSTQAENMHAFIRREHKNLIAIGEVGLDYRMVEEEAARGLQRSIFRSFIDLAMELDLPLNVHSRSAGRQVIDLLLERGARKVQLHAFDGKFGKAQPAVEAGYFFSIPPSIVRSRQKQKLLKQLPLSCLLLETDSPVLGPEPKERNEPANLGVCVKMISELKNIDPQELSDIVADNTQRLYGNIGDLLSGYPLRSS